MNLPDLVKLGWQFRPIWDAPVGIWHIVVTKKSWGLAKMVWSLDWDAAHEKARSWAECEERIINSDEKRDTIPAPSMEAAE